MISLKFISIFIGLLVVLICPYQVIPLWAGDYTLLPPDYPPRNITPDFFGIHGPDGYHPWGRDEMMAIGARLFRQTRAIPREIIHDPDVQLFWDEYIDACLTRGITCIVQLQLIDDYNKNKNYDDDVLMYTHYVQFVTRRYNGKVVYYVLGNEINRHSQWKKWVRRCALSAELCWDLVHPNAHLISLSLAFRGVVPLAEFMHQFLDLTGDRFLTHIDYHNYKNYKQAEAKYWLLRSILASRGLPDVHFFIGETGTWTCCFKAGIFKSQRDQAIDVVRRFVLPMSLEGVLGVCWSFGLIENTIFPQSSKYSHTGLIFDGSYCDLLPDGNCQDCDCEGQFYEKKTGYYTFARMTHFLKNSIFLSRETSAHIYNFSKVLLFHGYYYFNLTVLWSDTYHHHYVLDDRWNQRVWEINLITGQ